MDPDDTTNGANVIIWTPDNRITLVQHAYGAQNWALPGGAVRKGETPANAAIRETIEETGLTPLPELRHVALLAQRTLVHGCIEHGLCSLYSTQKVAGEEKLDTNEVLQICRVDLADIFSEKLSVGLGYKRMIAIWWNNRHSFSSHEGSLSNPVSTYVERVLRV